MFGFFVVAKTPFVPALVHDESVHDDDGSEKTGVVVFDAVAELQKVHRPHLAGATVVVLDALADVHFLTVVLSDVATGAVILG